MHAPAPVISPRHRLWLGGLAIVLLTLVVYLPAIRGGFIWDDDFYVTENELLRDLGGLFRLWVPGNTVQYYPMVFTTFWLEYGMWGLDALGYHLVNVLLHIANALLLWRLVRVVGLTEPGAWMVAALFALHPVHVESVAWITERKNVLSGLFYFAAALSYLRFDPMSDAPASKGRAMAYAASLLLYVLALLSKSVTCSLPATLILLMLYRRQPLRLRRLLPLAPFFLVGILAALNTVHIEQTSVGAVGAEFDFSLLERCLIASRALMFYPIKMIWPHPLIFFYPKWTIEAGDLGAYVPMAAVGVLAAACLVLTLRGRRGPAIAAAFYAGTILPALGFINVYPMRFSFVADHFNYLSSVGLIVLLVALIQPVFSRRVLGPMLIAVILLACSGKVWSQAGQYADLETLWRSTIAPDRNPDAWMAHNNLGNLLAERGQMDQAMVHFHTCLRVNPDHFRARRNLAKAFAIQERYDEALTQREIVLQHPEATLNDQYFVHLTQEVSGRLEEAIAGYLQVIERQPDHLATWTRLGPLLLRRGRTREALPLLESAVAGDPQNRPLRLLLHRLQGGQAESDGDVGAAIQHYSIATRQFRDHPLLHEMAVRLAALYALSPDPAFRNPSKAVRLAETLNRANPGQDPFVLHILGAAYAGQRRFDEARRCAEQALSIAKRKDARSPLVREIARSLEAYRAGQAGPEER